MVSMSTSLPDLLGNSSSNLSSADKPVKPEQLLEGDKTLRSPAACSWGQSPRLPLKPQAEILSQKEQKTPRSPSAPCRRGQLFASKSG